MLFHVLYQDQHHKSDWHLIIDAQNEKKAQEKVAHYLRTKHAESATIQILKQSIFAANHSQSSFFKIFFQNGTGEKHCQIIAEDQEAAEKIFTDRFSCKEIIRIENKKILTCIDKTKSKKNKQIILDDISAQPLSAAA